MSENDKRVFDYNAHSEFKAAVGNVGRAADKFKGYVDNLELRIFGLRSKVMDLTQELAISKAEAVGAIGDRDFYKRKFEEAEAELLKKRIEAFEAVGIDITNLTRPKNMLEAMKMFGISVEEIENSLAEAKSLRNETKVSKNIGDYC